MNAAPTIVVKFGAEVDPGEFFLVELDETMNRNLGQQGTIIFTYMFDGVEYFLLQNARGVFRLPAGEVRSRFTPGDHAYFLMHYDPARVMVTRVDATAGMVVLRDMVSRTATDQVLFDAPDEPRELTHIPAGPLTATWYGRTATIDRQGRQLTADATPAIADIAYPYTARSAYYVPPPMNLSGDAVYPVAIVISVEAVAP